MTEARGERQELVGSVRRGRSLLLAICLATVLYLPAFSLPVRIAPEKGEGGSGGSCEARLRAGNIGMLKLPGGSVRIHGNRLLVGAVPEWLFDRHEVLSGKLIRTRIETAGGQTSVSGFVYFTGGDWLNNLDDSKRNDNLTTATGGVLVGRIRAVNDDSVDFQLTTGKLRRVPLDQIKLLESPRGYVFRFVASGMKIDPKTQELVGDANSIAFNPSVKKVKRRGLIARLTGKKRVPTEPRSQLKGSEGGVTKAELSAFIFLDVCNTIAPAIVAPIVTSLGARPADRQLNDFFRREAAAQAQGFVIIP